MLKGKIFQSLLEDLRGAQASHAQVDLSARANGESGAEVFAIPRAQWVAMQAQADTLRNLVRIKIADDNDIKAARCALDTCAVTCKTLPLGCTHLASPLPSPQRAPLWLTARPTRTQVRGLF